MKRLLLALCLIGGLSQAMPANSPAAGISDTSFEVLVKLLSLNRHINLSRTDSLRVVIMATPEQPVSIQRQRQLRTIAASTHTAKPISLQFVDTSDYQQLRWSSINAFIFAGRLSGPVFDAVIQSCRRHEVLAASFAAEMLASGTALAVEDAPEQPEIYLNVTAVQNFGGVYDQQVLRLVKHFIWN